MMSPRERLRKAAANLARFTEKLSDLDEWRADLASRLDRARRRLDDGASDPGFEFLEAEVAAFAVARCKLIAHLERGKAAT